MKRVASKRQGEEEDEKDKVLEKLRSINYRLRKKLKFLNDKVEKAIDRTETKRILASRKKQPKDTAHMMLVKEKEIENAENQLESYKREIQTLGFKVDETSQVGKMIEIEQETKEHKLVISELKKAIRDKELNLEHLSKSDDPSYKVSSMNNEIRMWKEKIQRREELFERNEGSLQQQTQMIPEVEKDNDKLIGKIQELDSNIELEPNRARMKETSHELDSVKEEIKSAKENFERVKKENEKDLKNMKKKVEEATAERDEMYKKMKELDQEKRISSLKLREVGRMLKHNQLNPLGPVKASHGLTSRRSRGGSKVAFGKRGSVNNLHQEGKNKRKVRGQPNKKLSRGANTKSVQLLHKQKQYAKPAMDSDDDFEKNQTIDSTKLKKKTKH